MHIEIRTEGRLKGRGKLSEEVEDAVQKALGSFGDRITHVEVQLRDDDAYRSGSEDKRCLLETRLDRLAPIVTSHLASTVPEAVDGACGKMRRSLESQVERLG